jgi:hypothetical protein
MTTLTKTTVKPTWSPSKVQEETARLVASNCMAAQQAAAKLGEQALTEFQAAGREAKVAHLKSLGVSNALELAKALAEMEVNLFGSQIDISGDENKATLTYNHCAMWETMKKLGKFTPEQEEKMAGGFQSCMQSLAQDLGLNATVKFEGNTCAIDFAKA